MANKIYYRTIKLGSERSECDQYSVKFSYGPAVKDCVLLCNPSDDVWAEKLYIAIEDIDTVCAMLQWIKKHHS